MNPLGIVSVEPRLSWAVSSPTFRRGAKQIAYEILVARRAADLIPERADLWRSGKVASAESVDVRYLGTSLRSRERAYWKVRIWDENGRASRWSNLAWVEMALFDEEWAARWIGHPGVGRGAAYLRKAFSLPERPRKVRLYASAFGVAEIRINGRTVGGDRLAPGWTDYDKRVQFQTHDVTSLVRPGKNVVAAILAEGWYGVEVDSGSEKRRLYGPGPPRLLVQLEATLEDGKSERVVSDLTWTSRTGPIVSSSIRDGETYDARKELPGWDAPSFEAQSRSHSPETWRTPAEYEKEGERNLVPRRDPPLRVMDAAYPARVTRPRPGIRVYDFEKTVVGWARLRVAGARGSEVALRYARTLGANGMVPTSESGRLTPTDRYVLRGSGVETWEPHFTVHSFRYVEVSGLPEIPRPGAVTARRLDLDTPVTGAFETSDARLNLLHASVVSALAGAFIGAPAIPTMGDDWVGSMAAAQAVAATACFNRDLESFFRKWVADVRDAQGDDDTFSDAAPRLSPGAGGSPGWADGGVAVPWTAYAWYADRRIIDDHASAMLRWLKHVRQAHPDLIVKKAEGGRGDRLFLGQRTDPSLLATAFFARSAHLVAQAARAIGQEDRAREHDLLFRSIKGAFAKTFVAPDGRLRSDTQTAYALALVFGLLDGDLRALAATRFVERIEQDGGRLTTGILGTPHLLPALSLVGQDDVAFRILTSSTAAPWAWALGQWMYATIGGINLDPDRPGGRHVLIEPRPLGAPHVSRARTSYDSVYGAITVAWRIEAGAFSLAVTLPANTTATVRLPFAGAVTESGEPAAAARGVTVVRGSGDRSATLRLDSGHYDLQVPVPSS